MMSNCPTGSPLSRHQRGMPAARISSSMSVQGVKARSHQTPGMSFITP